MAKVFYFMFSFAGWGDRFKNRAVEKLAVTFERGIGAKFSLKWSMLANQSRKKGRKRMVTGPVKMTLLSEAPNWAPLDEQSGAAGPTPGSAGPT